MCPLQVPVHVDSKEVFGTHVFRTIIGETF